MTRPQKKKPLDQKSHPKSSASNKKNRALELARAARTPLTATIKRSNTNGNSSFNNLPLPGRAFYTPTPHFTSIRRESARKATKPPPASTSTRRKATKPPWYNEHLEQAKKLEQAAKEYHENMRRSKIERRLMREAQSENRRDQYAALVSQARRANSERMRNKASANAQLSKALVDAVSEARGELQARVNSRRRSHQRKKNAAATRIQSQQRRRGAARKVQNRQRDKSLMEFYHRGTPAAVPPPLPVPLAMPPPPPAPPLPPPPLPPSAARAAPSELRPSELRFNSAQLLNVASRFARQRPTDYSPRARILRKREGRPATPPPLATSNVLRAGVRAGANALRKTMQLSNSK